MAAVAPMYRRLLPARRVLRGGMRFTTQQDLTKEKEMTDRNPGEIRAGDTVVLRRIAALSPALGGGSVTYPAGRRALVTRVYPSRLMVRPAGEDYSYTMDRDAAEVVDLESIRPYGRKPQDTEEQIYIGLDHPGIQWLFDDMGRLADERGWCSEYDSLCTDLGIPPRRPFHEVTWCPPGAQARSP